mmetsp:Transcript_6934/g.20059  ORF Transcript_6934/g.20059 Transcript_6934/m.20059 type:complete len:348 (+) Transcript_6934:80-1123(+)
MSKLKRKKIKSNNSGRKRGGWLRSKKVISSFLSRFSSSRSPESTDQDEVLKPLYYIAGDSRSVQMEATVQTFDDQSKDRNEIDDGYSQQARLNAQFSLLSNVRSDSSFNSLDGTIFPEHMYGRDNPIRFGPEKPTFATEIGVEMAENHQPKGRALSKLYSPSILAGMKSSGCRLRLRRFFKRTFMRRPNRQSKKCVSPSCSMEDSFCDLTTRNETKEDTIDSDDKSLPTTVLGVTYAHPVYTGECNVLLHNAKSGIEAALWSKMDRSFFAEVDACNLPPTKTIVETGVAESWRSVSSSSMYPTDEQSVEQDFFYSSSFDSDVDIPFDETFPGNVFESGGRNYDMHEI